MHNSENMLMTTVMTNSIDFFCISPSVVFIEGNKNKNEKQNMIK